MESEPILDISALLEPIPGDNPAGVDLRADQGHDSKFRQIKDASARARQLEKKAAEDAEKPPAESLELWKAVRNKGLAAVKDDTKDLEIAAYVMEALLRLDRFAGVHAGLELVRGLIERFADHLYPRPDEGEGIEATVFPLIRLDGDVIAHPLRMTTITQDKAEGPFAIWQYRQAETLEGLSLEERQTRIERGAVSKEMFAKAVAETSQDFFKGNYQDLLNCREELKRLAEVIHQRYPKAATNFGTIAAAVEDGLAVLRLAAPQVVKDEGSKPAGDGKEFADATPKNGRSLLDIALNKREDALKLLERVATFFERTEPQSLIPAQLRKVVRWGRLSPAELYTELIEDQPTRQQIFKLIGISIPSSEQQENGS